MSNSHPTGARWFLVPREPTPDMIHAAHSALFNWREKSGDPQKEASMDQKHAIRWRAMFAAFADRSSDQLIAGRHDIAIDPTGFSADECREIARLWIHAAETL